jgi:hypothetical protein
VRKITARRITGPAGDELKYAVLEKRANRIKAIYIPAAAIGDI